MLMRRLPGSGGFIRILTLTAASLQHWIDTMHAARIAAAMFQTSFPGGRRRWIYPADDGDING